MKVLLVGESWTVHETHMKGFDIFDVCRHEEHCGDMLANVLRKEGIDVDFMPSHEAQVGFPDTIDKLNAYDAVILSDIGSNTLLLAPDTFYRGVRSPNKLKALVDYAEQGGGVAMIGGYLSFAGIDNKARYAMTPLAKALPVEILSYDDRVECPEGIVPQVKDASHSIFDGVGKDWPFFLGYNKIKAKKEAKELATINEDTFIAVMEFGKGRTLAFASDCAPHWGPKEFVDWQSYQPLFGNMVRWLCGKM